MIVFTLVVLGFCWWTGEQSLTTKIVFTVLVFAGEARQRATEALEARRGEGRDEGSRRAKDDGPGDRERTGNMLTTIRERGRVD